jgi:hypothetical protein
MHDDASHHVRAHYGVRTSSHKLIYYYSEGLGVLGASSTSHPPEWELFDLTIDPAEMRNVYHDPEYAEVRSQLTAELDRLILSLGDQAMH